MTFTTGLIRLQHYLFTHISRTMTRVRLIIRRSYQSLLDNNDFKNVYEPIHSDTDEFKGPRVLGLLIH